MVRRGLAAGVCVAAMTAAAPGCGDDQEVENVSPGGDVLPAVVVARVERARDAVKRFCSRTGTPDVDQAVTVLIRTYRAHPEASFESGGVARQKTMREVLLTQAHRLRGCGAPGPARRLAAAARR